MKYVLPFRNYSHEINVTVVCLAYNSPHIMSSIDSILKQTYENMQLIVADDGSENFIPTDIIEYCRSHDPTNVSEIILLTRNRNLGTVKNLNDALRFATGKYLFFLSADDIYYDTDVIRDWVKEFHNSNASVITAFRDVYNSDLSMFIHKKPDESQATKIENLSSSELFQNLCYGNFILGSSTAIKMEVLRQFGFYDERYRLVEDYPMNLKLLRSGVDFHFYRRTVVICRDNGSSSKAKFGVYYRKDSDLIFRNEILSYSSSKCHVWMHYHLWRIKRLRHFIYAQSFYGIKCKYLKLILRCVFFPDVCLYKAIKSLIHIDYR